MSARMIKRRLRPGGGILPSVAALLLCVAAQLCAQRLDLPVGGLATDEALVRAMPALAKSAIAVFRESDRSTYLNTLFRLQMVAGDDSAAIGSLKALTQSRRAGSPSSALPLMPFEMLAEARLKAARGGKSFEEEFREGFRQTFDRLRDSTAAEALHWFVGDIDRKHSDVRDAADKLNGKNSIELSDAVDLLRKHQLYQAFRLMGPLTGGLIADDDARRYNSDREILIETPDAAHIAAMAMRPKEAKGQLPTLLVFTIYADDEWGVSEARKMAAHGYAGVVAYSRGKGRSPDAPVPYEHDGDDARAVIDWITRQSWSDGRVGMYGGSYNGFTQWAAAKHLPPALKTIVPYVAAIPGLGLPMENNVFLNANYGWAFYVTDNKYLDKELYGNRQRWESLPINWYASGRAYRDIDRIDGMPNPSLQRWLDHPAYDVYWQSMVPYKDDFSKITIPVLTITGYYDDGQISALQYLKEHYRYNKNADHYLLIGPYDHFGAQQATKERVLRGYAIDSVAQFDTPEITFQWMDYIFRGAKKPPLLKDKINYEVMGSNIWKHAPSLEMMSNQALTLYLSDVKLSLPETRLSRLDLAPGNVYELSGTGPASPGSLHQEINLADRKSTNNDYYPDTIVGKHPDLSNGYVFISKPFDAPVEIAGTFSGLIKARVSTKDLDIGVVLYEVMPDGRLVHLSYFLGRASYASDMSVRKLLTPDSVEAIPFDRTRMVCRKLVKGSRLLVALNVNKNPYAQINYGSGYDVSDEDINDGQLPLKVDWQNDSYVKIPIWK